jgi:hypothetical protein
MDQKTVQRVSSQVYRQFPEMAGVKPKLRPRPEGKTASNRGSKPTYLLTYNVSVTVAGGQSMPRWVRVVADNYGKIIKITTSR